MTERLDAALQYAVGMKFLGLVSSAGQLVLLVMGAIVLTTGVVLVASLAFPPLLAGFTR